MERWTNSQIRRATCGPLLDTKELHQPVIRLVFLWPIIYLLWVQHRCAHPVQVPPSETIPRITNSTPNTNININAAHPSQALPQQVILLLGSGRPMTRMLL